MRKAALARRTASIGQSNAIQIERQTGMIHCTMIERAVWELTAQRDSLPALQSLAEEGVVNPPMSGSGETMSEQEDEAGEHLLPLGKIADEQPVEGETDYITLAELFYMLSNGSVGSAPPPLEMRQRQDNKLIERGEDNGR